MVVDCDMQAQRVAVVGGGVSGIAAAKAFKTQGHDVLIIERSSSCGGVWSPLRSYPGVKTQSSRDLYRFTDLDYSEDTPEWPSGKAVLSYLDSYIKKHGLEQHCRLNTEVVAMERVEKGGWLLVTQTSGSSHVEKNHFDFVVIATGTFTNPRFLHHAGQDEFVSAGGLIKHSSEYNDLEDNDVRDQHVLVLGGSKSATDIAAHLYTRGAGGVSLVMRRNVWRIPYFIGNLVNSKHLLYMRAQEVQFSSWRDPTSVLGSILSCIAAPVIWLNFRMLELLLIVQLGLRKWKMVPKTKIEDEVSCEIPVVTQGLFESFESGDVRPVKSTIERYEVKNDGTKIVQLENGEAIQAHVVVQATGWTMDLPFLPRELEEELIDADGQYRLYRFAINPNLPDIGFVGFNSSFCSVLSSEMIAHWLVRYMDGKLVNQPSRQEIDTEIDRLLKWKRKARPAAKAYGGNCVAPFHFAHFDELLEDMGAAKDSSWFTYPHADNYAKLLASAPHYQVNDTKGENKICDEDIPTLRRVSAGGCSASTQ